MEWTFLFFLNSFLLGAGLAMDAFSVSVANGLHEPDMPARRAFLIAGTFAAFQFLMPLAGWALVHTAEQVFTSFGAFVPWIALVLLALLGGKMIFDGIRGNGGEPAPALSYGMLAGQGVATSIDALSTGFAIAEYPWYGALAASLVIGLVTLALCLAGIRLGRVFGTKLSDKATIFGGIILIAVGIEIFITG